MTQWIEQHPHCELVYATDVDFRLIEFLRSRFQGNERVIVAQHDIHDVFVCPRSNRPVDTVVCINVLEHIQDDEKALAAVGASLDDHGRLLLLVPAHPWLYGSVDEGVGHCRRYTKNELIHKLSRV
ncbi:MAG: class I SAM-dependent methyltransferase, partial [Deltaproteobacteria bacterium]|nr:class I SAM-dependent methyltransferase [Deltaproteobacteria bacterium]